MRKYNTFIIRFQKQYIKKLGKVAQLMPKDFKDGYFIEVFQKSFPSLWENIVKHREYYDEADKRLAKNKYNFPAPHIFLLNASKHILPKTRKLHLNSNYIHDIDYKNKINNFIEENSKQYSGKLRDKNILRQKVQPQYLDDLEKEYFSTQDLDKKANIFNELIKYNNTKTKEILHKINTREYNPSLKYKAFQTLQEMGEVVFLRKNKKGKNKYKNIYPSKNAFDKTPEQVLEEIHNDSIQKYKKYDIFLSHSYRNLANIIEFVQQLNSLNFVVYVDWISDKEGLKRDFTSHSTVKVIKERMKKSKVLIYFNTENTDRSFWIPWEIGFFDGMNGKILIYHQTNSKSNEILDSYLRLVEENELLLVKTEQSKQNLIDWITIK